MAWDSSGFVHPPLAAVPCSPPGEGWVCSQCVLTLGLNTEAGDSAATGGHRGKTRAEPAPAPRAF